MKKTLYKLEVDCGRSGELNGLFISYPEYVKVLLEQKIVVYFGEVLGKHSEIFGTVENNEIIFVSDNEEVIKVVEENKLEHGFNPFNYESIRNKRKEFNNMTVKEIVEQLIKEQNETI